MPAEPVIFRFLSQPDPSRIGDGRIEFYWRLWRRAIAAGGEPISRDSETQTPRFDRLG